jgi:preprotein translocase subunit YajC
MSHQLLLAQAGAPQPDPLVGMLPIVLVFFIFYFIWLRPMRQKQRRLDSLIRNLKSGDKVIVNPGIFGTIVGVEDDSFHVRVDDKTKIRVLKSAVAGLQAAPAAETEKK